MTQPDHGSSVQCRHCGCEPKQCPRLSQQPGDAIACCPECDHRPQPQAGEHVIPPLKFIGQTNLEASKDWHRFEAMRVGRNLEAWADAESRRIAMERALREDQR